MQKFFDERKALFAAILGGLVIAFLGVVAIFLNQYFGILMATGVIEATAFIAIAIWMLIRRESVYISWDLEDPGEKPKRGMAETGNSQTAFLLFCVTEATSKWFFVIAIILIGVASAVFYLYAALFAATFLIGRVVFKNPIKRVQIYTLGLAILGLVFYTFPIDTTLSRGLFFALLARLSDAIHFATLNDSYVVEHIKPRVRLFWSDLIAAILLFSLAIISGEDMVIKQIDWQLAVALPIIGLLFWALGELVIYSFSRLPINTATIALSTELLWVIPISAILYAEYPTVAKLFGVACILASIAIREFWPESKQPERKSTALKEA